MNERTHDRLFAACGIASVVLELGGVAIGAAGGKTHDRTISSTPAQIAHALAKPAGTAVWVGAYIELLSVGCFLAFAVWACAKLGGGLLGADRPRRRRGLRDAQRRLARRHGRDRLPRRPRNGRPARRRTLVTRQRGALRRHLVPDRVLPARSRAARAARRAGGRSAGARSAIAVVTLVATAVSLDNLGQMSDHALLAWIVCASIALGAGDE